MTNLDLLDLFVIGRGNAVQERGHLGSEVCSGDERTQYVFG